MFPFSILNFNLPVRLFPSKSLLFLVNSSTILYLFPIHSIHRLSALLLFAAHNKDMPQNTISILEVFNTAWATMALSKEPVK